MGVFSNLLQSELSARLAEKRTIRRRNFRINDNFLVNPRLLDRTLTEVGQGLLNTDEIRDIDPDLFRADPLRAIQEILPEGDPRGKSLVKTREDIQGFLSLDNRNKFFDPSKLISTVLQKNLGDFQVQGAADVQMSSVLLGATKDALGRVVPSASDLAFATAELGVIEGARRHFSKRGPKGKGIERGTKSAKFFRGTALHSSRPLLGKAAKSVARRIATIGSNFIPGPGRAVAPLLLRALGVLETQQLVFGASEFARSGMARSGFSQENPKLSAAAEFLFSIGAPGTLYSKVRGEAPRFRSKKERLDDILAGAEIPPGVSEESWGKLLETTNSAILGKFAKAGEIYKRAQGEIEAIKHSSTRQIGSPRIRGFLPPYKSENLVDYINPSKKINRSEDLLNEAMRDVRVGTTKIKEERELVRQRLLQDQPIEGIRRTEGGGIPLRSREGELVRKRLRRARDRSKRGFTEESPDVFTKKLREQARTHQELFSGPVGKGISSAINRTKEQLRVQRTGNLREKLEGLKKEGINKNIAQQRLKNVDSPITEGPPSSLLAKKNFMLEPSIPPSVKQRFNQSISNYAKKGLGDEEATALAFEDIAPLLGQKNFRMRKKIKPSEVESSFGKHFLSAKNPVKNVAKEQRFPEAKKIEEELYKGADELGTSIEKLSDKQVVDILRKGGLISVLSTLALATSTEDAEAGPAGVAARFVQRMGEIVFGQKLSKREEFINQRVEFFLNKHGSSKDIASEKSAANKATMNAKKMELELDKIKVENGHISLKDEVFGAIFNVFNKTGKEGVLTTAKFKSVDDLSEFALVDFEKKMKEALPLSNSFLGKRRRNLNKEEGKLIHDWLAGKRKKLPRQLLHSAQQIRKALDEVFDFAQDSGIPVVGYRKDYFPQILKAEALGTQKGRAQIAEHLLKVDPRTGKSQVRNMDEATQIVGAMLRDRSVHFFNTDFVKTIKAGRVELSRRFSFPEEMYVGGDGVHVLEALTTYASQVFQRGQMVRMFGVKNENLQLLRSKLVEKHPQNKEYIETAMDVLQGLKPFKASFRAPQAFNRFTNFARALETIDLMGYAQIPQLAQMAYALVKVGPSNLFKGASRMLTPGSSTLKGQNRVDFIRSSAVVSQVMAKHLSEQFGAISGVAQEISQAALKAYLVLPTDRVARFVAGSAGAEYAGSLVKQAGRRLKGKELENTRRAIEELGLNFESVSSRARRATRVKHGSDLLTDEELRTAIKRVSDMTQFRSRPGDVPLWFQSEYAKIVTQFKSFLTQSGSAINQMIVKEALAGNPTPLIRASIAAPIMGHYVLQARDNLKMTVADLAGDHELKRRTRKRRKFVTRPGGGLFKKPRSALMGKSYLEVMTDAGYIMALGVLPDIVDDSVRAKGINVSSPTVDRIFRLTTAALADVEDGRVDRLEKEVRRLIPLGLGERR